MKSTYENRFVNSFLNTSPIKRPKLDISESSTTNTCNKSSGLSEDKVKISSQSKTLFDDCWGPDLNEDDLNTCCVIESQAVQGISLEPNASHNIVNSVILRKETVVSNVKETRTHGKFNSKVGGTPLYKTQSLVNFSSTPRTSGYGSSSANFLNKAETQSQTAIIKDECKSLKEEIQKKVGEITMLRSRLKKVDSENREKVDYYVQQLKETKDEHQKEKQRLEKQVNELSTSLQFKAMEKNASEERHRTSKDTRLKNPSYNHSRKSSDFDKSFHFTEETHMKSCNSVDSLKWGLGNLNIGVHQGNLLTKFIDPNIYFPENRSLLSECNLFDKDRRGMEVIRGDALTNCFIPLMHLYKCESFSVASAKYHIKVIIRECMISLSRQLQQMKSDGPPGQLTDRSKSILQKSHTVLPLTESYSWLTPKKLYPDEQGVETRRMLTLMDILVRISEEAHELIIPGQFPVENVNSSSKTNRTVEVSQGANVSASANQSIEKQSSVLHVIRDIVSLISSEMTSLMYNGILATSAKFLTSLIEKNSDLSKDCQLLLLDIIHWVLKCRPGPTVILYVAEFLYCANSCYFIVSNLCSSTVHSLYERVLNVSSYTYENGILYDYNNELCYETCYFYLDYVDKSDVEYDWYYVFDDKTCLVTVLCYLVQVIGHNKKYLLTDSLSKWFLNLLTLNDKSGVPYWSTLYKLHDSDICKDCACPWNISKVITTLLCEAAILYYTERNKLGGNERTFLETILERGVLLLHRMLYLKSLGHHVGYIEGQYELFIHTISMLEPALPLRPLHQDALDEMLMQENYKEPPIKKEVIIPKEVATTIFTV